MTRQVTAEDGRQWTVRSKLEWREPAVGDQFEHEVASGRVGGVFMLIVLLAFIVALAVLTPDAVVVPPWLIAAFVVLVLFFPVRWLVRLPWTLVVETNDSAGEQQPERWVGNVRGVFNARNEAARAAKHLKKYSMPDREGDGPLQHVD